jgi:ribose 5-phosphate isomerase B
MHLRQSVYLEQSPRLQIGHAMHDVNALALSGKAITDRGPTEFLSQPIGIVADHGGFELKQHLVRMLHDAGHRLVDFGDHTLGRDDDYPDFVVQLAHAVAVGHVTRGIAICGSGVGVCVAANKVAGVRACLIHDTFSAHQGVEDDDLNVICLGGLVVGDALAWELVQTFLAARFSGAERHRRRLAKVRELEIRAKKERSWRGTIETLRTDLASRFRLKP